jgi:hypothetical protein
MKIRIREETVEAIWILVVISLSIWGIVYNLIEKPKEFVDFVHIGAYFTLVIGLLILFRKK